MNIQFSPPDVSELEIQEIAKALRSGWITTGPKTKLFEKQIAEYCGSARAVCLNSATAALEMVLRVMGVGHGDEVITSVYTYTATASSIHHLGAKIVFVDTAKDSFEMDYDQLADAITERTKVIVPVDMGGVICDYDRIYQIIEEKKHLFRPQNDIQRAYGRVIISSDAAHSFGASRNGKKAGAIADFTSFSFHAVKNLTTAEGGAVTWINHEGVDNDALYKEMMLWSLHGQSKDALNKMKVGSWEYDILYPGHKCNMTDLTAAFGLAQLQRFDGLMAKRAHIYDIYNSILDGLDCTHLEHNGVDSQGNYHLYLLRINGIDEATRNEIILKMGEHGIACNVHFKPLAMMTAYKNLGFDIQNYPNAYAQYCNEITLPMHTLLSDEEAVFVANTLRKILKDRTDETDVSHQYEIRRIWATDNTEIAQISRIYKECGEKMFLEYGLLHWVDVLSDAHFKEICMNKEMYVVKDGHKTVAFFSISTAPNSYFEITHPAIYLGKMAVAPDVWRQGIGTFCLDWIRCEAMRRGIGRIRTTVYRKSKNAVRFLETRGFVKLYERSTKHFVVDCDEILLDEEKA